MASHSLQPYRGCSYGNSLCGVGCYVQHAGHWLQGRAWGSFLEVRTNAAESYREHVSRERRWTERRGEPFAVLCSSVTDPFLPQETRYGITASVLDAMIEQPPDRLILQTHSHLVERAAALLLALGQRCDLRVHVSIESDRDRLPGLPPPASSVEQRFDACAALRRLGLRTLVTVAPLFPIAAPEAFFQRIAEVADAVVIDHFVEGDGSADGRRTRSTRLPEAMAAVNPASIELSYREAMSAVARKHMPSRV